MFQTVVMTLLPVFVVVGAGYACGRLGILGAGSDKVLSMFVTHVSLPVLLFGALASESLGNIFNVAFVASFGAATVICFLLPWAVLPGRRAGLGVRAMRGLGASFAGVSFIAIPVVTPLVGSVALPAIAVANIIVLAMMGLAIVCVEVERNRNAGIITALRLALLHTFKNPMIFGTIAGLVYSVSGLGLPHWILSTTELLGDATPPVALFALGMALVGRRLGRLAEIGLLTAIKLLVMPLVTLGILMLFPAVDPKWAVAAVALAAMSTAVLEYILAQEFHEYIEEASGVVLISTVLSAVTLPVFIIWSLHIWPIT